MAQLWQGRASKAVDSRVNDFNSSIRFDARMIEQDIQGSLVHSAMLGRQGIISAQDVEDIHKGLHGILEDLHSGALEIDPAAEDVHTFVEQTLTARVGDAGKRLHTGRSRNDQVALDLRLNLREASAHLQGQIQELIETICTQAAKGADYVMPGYTHLQRAQPVTFGHQLMAYAWMLLRDLGRMRDLNTLLVMMKGIPLAYDKDMQEDKEAIFDAVDTLELCLRTVTPMLATMTPLPANMRRAAAKGFINATDCADYLTKKGMPFRDAYKCTGTMVAACIAADKTLEELTLEEFKQYSDLFEEDVYQAIDLTTCCEGRTSYGGPTKASVLQQIELVREKLADQ